MAINGLKAQGAELVTLKNVGKTFGRGNRRVEALRAAAESLRGGHDTPGPGRGCRTSGAGSGQTGQTKKPPDWCCHSRP